jgi:hypothetical protein
VAATPAATAQSESAAATASFKRPMRGGFSRGRRSAPFVFIDMA